MADRRGEAEVVLGTELAEILDEWKFTYDKKNGILHRQWWSKYDEDGEMRKDSIPYMNAFDWLAQETGINVRALYRYWKGEREYVSFKDADLILTALGLHLHGTVHVIPNPRWDILKWVEYMQNRGCW